MPKQEMVHVALPKLPTLGACSERQGTHGCVSMLLPKQYNLGRMKHTPFVPRHA